MTQNTHSTTMTPNITHNPQPQTLSSNVAQISNICTVSSTYCTTSIQCSTEPSTSTLSPNRAQNMHTEKVPVQTALLSIYTTPWSPNTTQNLPTKPLYNYTADRI